MPRRAEITPRPVTPDPVYESQLVTQLMNRVMRDGKKSTAEAIVYSALDKVGEKTGRPPDFLHCDIFLFIIRPLF